MKVKTQYDKNKRFISNAGCKEHILYSSRFNEDGQLELFEVGKQNIPEMINSHAESVDINKIIERFHEGDVSVLNRRPMMFGDFTELPKTYADVLNLARAGEEYFDSLPLDVKQKFNNNFAEWLSTIDKVRAAQAVEKASASGEEVPSEPVADEKQA